MNFYLIKLRVEGLFYNCSFVLGFLLNIWLEVPETEERETIILDFVPGYILSAVMCWCWSSCCVVSAECGWLFPVFM